jgi:hypothetical protein
MTKEMSVIESLNSVKGRYLVTLAATRIQCGPYCVWLFQHAANTIHMCVDGLYSGDSDVTRRRCVFGVENPERHNCVCNGSSLRDQREER